MHTQFSSLVFKVANAGFRFGDFFAASDLIFEPKTCCNKRHRSNDISRVKLQNFDDHFLFPHLAGDEKNGTHCNLSLLSCQA